MVLATRAPEISSVTAATSNIVEVRGDFMTTVNHTFT